MIEDSDNSPDDEVETDALPEDEISSEEAGHGGDDGNDPPVTSGGGGEIPPDFDVSPINIEDEMRTSYLD